MTSGRTGDAGDAFYQEFGSRVRRARSERLTQQALAVKVGLSRAAIANVEVGRQRVPLHMLYRFAEALDVAPAELLPQGTEPADDAVAKSVAKLGLRDQQAVLRVIGRAREERMGRDG